MWKTGIALAGMLLLLILMVSIRIEQLVHMKERRNSLAPLMATVQASPTVNVTATMTELQEDKLRQEVQQLKYQNEQLKTRIRQIYNNRLSG